MTRLTGPRRVVAILAIATAVGGSGLLGADAFAGRREPAVPRTPRVLGPGPVTVRIDIHYSRFHPDRIRVHPHTELTFEVANHDPIGHELIIGGPEVHARHAHGTEAYHPPKPGEVSIAPGEVGTTTYELHAPGTVLFACHLPGHFEYGMVGEVVVQRH